MSDYRRLAQHWQDGPLARWADCLADDIARDFNARRHAELPRWQQALAALPALVPDHSDIDTDTVRVGRREDCTAPEQAALVRALRALQPWRKGPFELFGIHIDTEWRSDWKWQRLLPALQPLAGRRVLDVGCGSGYHCWRMLGAGAAEVIGIDPTPLYVMQFRALQHYLQRAHIWVLPLAMEQLPGQLQAFDTVFSMGVLYHRRSPIGHLQALRGCLTRGGQLVLETLVIEGGENACLVPPGRYARMRNVWFIPTCELLQGWLHKLGFKDVTLVDVTPTRCAEQRTTDWMPLHSLADFLDPSDPARTIEGHPAPRRAIVSAIAP